MNQGQRSRELLCVLGCLLTGLLVGASPLTVCGAEVVEPVAAEAAEAAEISAEDLDFFEQQVRPLLADRCLKCHAADSEGGAAGGLMLDSRAGWMKGGDLGAAIVPGSPDESLLMEAVEQRGDRVRMPPDGRLSAAEVETLRRWIARGAPDPRAGSGSAAGRADGVLAWEREPAQGADFWAFQPVRRPASPSLATEYRERPLRSPIDLLMASAWEARGLEAVGEADPRDWIRRVTLDLTGVPPTPGEVNAFLADSEPGAAERLVDRLLASPRYGQRWGRFWLDVARYADSNGLDENIAHGNAWRYRDYVIDAWNEDKPFDRFVVEQLAGDLDPTPASPRERSQRLVATGFLVLGPKVLAEVDETKMEMDIIDEQVETTGRAFLGLTLGCARCHDHKFDPIRTRDYYALAGIFKSTRTMEHFKKIARWNEVTIATEEQQAAREAAQTRLDSLREELRRARERLSGLSNDGSQATGAIATGGESERNTLAREVERLQPLVDAAQADLQACVDQLPSTMAVADQPEVHELPIHVRGNHLTLGEMVARQVPQVLSSPDFPPPTMPANASGRWELAQWLVDPRQPLTSRVLVNRLWRWHFGRGLVGSTDNLGRLGDTPTHPELLDWLASELVHGGWSIKRLQRTIVLSHVYRLASRSHAQNEAIDPGNQLGWRFERKRLEAEAIRDSLLSVSGLLDEKMGGSLLHVKNREFLFDHTSKDNTRYDARCRSVYLPVIRNHLYDMFQLFDYGDDSVTNSDRATTTVAPQALFLLNGDLARMASRALAERLVMEHDSLPERLELGYQTVFGRSPRASEIERDQRFLEAVERQLTAKVGAEPASASEASSDSQARPLRAWSLLVQAWLSSSEFVYVR